MKFCLKLFARMVSGAIGTKKAICLNQFDLNSTQAITDAFGRNIFGWNCLVLELPSCHSMISVDVFTFFTNALTFRPKDQIS